MLRSLECEVCEDQSNTIEALKQARIAEIDCGQEGICARPPSCQKHWAFRASELARERDEARRELAAERERLSSVRQLLKVAEKMYDECANMLTTEREAHEKTKQSACGFAWDVGAEMSRNDGYCMRRPDGTIECRRFVCHQPCAARPGAVSDVEVDASDYERPGKVKP